MSWFATSNGSDAVHAPSPPGPSSPPMHAPEDHHQVPAASSEAGPLMAIPLTGFALAFAAGLYQAANRSSLVFMAENAHRRPDTVQGWYFYNKTKNYKVLLAGIGGGLKTGARVGLWTLAFVGIEHAATRLQQEHFKQSRWQGGRWMPSGVAGLAIASGASMLYRLPGPVARRALLLGVVSGTSVGTLRDVQQQVSQRRAEQ